MRDQRDEPTPVELRSVAERLRGCRYEASPLELDRIKQRAMAQVSSPSGNPHKGMLMRSKLLSTALAVGLLFCTTSLGLAVTGNFPGSGSGSAATRQAPGTASSAQYGGSKACKNQRRTNRAQEKALVRQHRRAERRLRGQARKRAIRRNRAQERRFRARNRSDEARCRRTGKTGSP